MECGRYFRGAVSPNLHTLQKFRDAGRRPENPYSYIACGLYLKGEAVSANLHTLRTFRDAGRRPKNPYSDIPCDRYLW